MKCQKRWKDSPRKFARNYARHVVLHGLYVFHLQYVLVSLPLQVLRIIARVNVRGNTRLAEEAFHAYTAIVAKGSGTTSRPHSTPSDESRIGSALYADHRISTAEDAAPLIYTEPLVHAPAEVSHDPTLPRLPDEALLRFASSAPHRSLGGSDEEEMSGSATLLALMQALYLLIAMHKEMRLRQLNSHRIVPSESAVLATCSHRTVSCQPCLPPCAVVLELAHTVTLMAYDKLAAAWQGPGGRDPTQLLVLTGGMMCLQAVLFRDNRGLERMVGAEGATNEAARHVIASRAFPVSRSR